MMKLTLYPVVSRDQQQREDLQKHYHPFLKMEKELSSIVQRILPKPIADSMIRKVLGFHTFIVFQRPTRRNW